MDLTTDSTLKSFSAPHVQSHLPTQEHFRYLQISNFLATFMGASSSLTSLTFYKDICNSDPQASGLITKLYYHFNSPPPDLPPYASKWASELGMQLEQKDWDGIWIVTKSSSQKIASI